MSHPFNPKHGPILVEAEVTGPVGYDLANITDRVRMTTGSGSAVRSVPKVILTRLTALGQHRFGFPVLAYSLPASASVSGQLGLDFLRDHVLTIDFRTGQMDLA